jgi:hypothetical protein
MRRLLCVFGAVAIGSVTAAQIRLPDLPARLPSLSSLLQGEPLTTSLDDAGGALPMLDDYSPARFAPMMALPGGTSGGYRLRPGLYTLTVESYCLQPGAFRPGRGDGYVVAPLKGPGADAVQTILRGTAAHPEIPQSDVQVLLWGIIARTPVQEMDAPLQTAARTLMTPAQITRANGGALAMIPQEIRDQLFARADPVTRRVLDAEAQIRERLAQPGATLDELEEIAMPERDASAERGPEVPPSRWSFDARGYFVRYQADTYSEMTMEVYAPEPFAIGRDTSGRVTRVADSKGRRIIVEYGTGTAIKSARIERLARLSHRTRARSESATLIDAAPAGDAAWAQQLADFGRRWTRAGGSPLPRGYEASLDLLRLRRGLKAAAARQPGTIPAWAVNEIDLLANAFQFALCRAAGRCGALAARAERAVPHVALVNYAPPSSRPLAFQSGGTGTAGGGEADPSGGAAVPGGSGKQRLGPSRKPKKCPPPEDISKLEARLKFVEKAAELAQNYADDPRTEFDDGDDFYDRFKRELEQEFGPIGDQGSFDSSTGTSQNNVPTCADGDYACQVTASETDDHEDQHGRNNTECQGGGDNGTCGNSGRDYARDEKSAYDESAKRLRDAIDHAKSCKG